MELPKILFEDNHVIVLRKPAGMPSQADDSRDESMQEWAMAYIKAKYNKPGNVYLGLLHRLDRPASGAMAFARTSKAAARLSAQFQTREVRKVYHVVSIRPPQPPAASLQHYLEQREGEKIIMRAYPHAGAGRKQALLTYKTLATKEGLSLLEIQLETGRKHQIRVQLSAIGCPVVGDLKYGAPSPLPDKSIALHAHSLRFEHPVLKTMVEIEAERPTCWPWNLFAGEM